MSAHANVTTGPDGRLRVANGPSGGEFATHDRTSDDVTLNSWPASPTDEQRSRAADEVRRRMAAYPGVISDPDTLTHRLAGRIAEQEACYMAFKAGIPHPDDTAYETLWETHDSRGIDRYRAKEALRYWESIHAELLSGQTHPRALLGRDATDADLDRAASMATDGIALYEEAFTCAGRNLSINQLVVTQKRVDAIEAATPF